MDVITRRSYRGPIRLVVFDWAGTTVDHGCIAPVAAFVETFKRRGVEIGLAEARAPMGLAKQDHIAAIAKQPGVAERWLAAQGRPCTETDVADMYERDFMKLQVACVADHAKLIGGLTDCVADLKQRGIKIGSSSGYFTEAMAIVLDRAKRQGYEPDATFCTGDVPAGRPEPWMMYANMRVTRTFPPEAVVKVGDTVPDIGEGLNAGAWTVGVTRTGNELGLSEDETDRLAPDDLAARITRADETLRHAGAHFVVESVREVPLILDRIEDQLRAGERP